MRFKAVLILEAYCCDVVWNETGRLNSANVLRNGNVGFIVIVVSMVIVAWVDSAQWHSGAGMRIKPQNQFKQWWVSEKAEEPVWMTW